MTNPTRILIADDHEVVREGSRVLIEREPGWQVCGVAKDGRSAVEMAEELRPDIVVLDMSMPEMNGLEAGRRIKRALPKTEVLILTAHESDELIREVFESGIKAYILKSESGTYLVDALRSLAEHKPYFTSTVSEVLFSRMLEGKARKESEDESNERLTARERQIVQLLAEGKSNKEVADQLSISLRTAETHRASIMRKLRLDSAAALVRYAIRNRMIDP